MKTYLMICLCIGILHTTTAQNDIAAVTNLKLTKASSKTMKANANYLNSIDTEAMAERALKLRTLVAAYNLKTSDEYDAKEKSVYTVNFKEGQNKVIATYDNNGNILQCKEVYKDIRLPLSVSQKLIKENPGYHIGNTMCKIDYNTQSATKTINYKVELLNDTDRKVVRLTI
ncbi:hypothetical protein [Winogradskyella sp. A3E31]|uniref:hypothetical protein n=1 Tax=Winogradskyella sp. A3E31 TaxID=3349637 RepID=UPI00398B3367